jgi:hypothetical protein
MDDEPAGSKPLENSVALPMPASAPGVTILTTGVVAKTS